MMDGRGIRRCRRVLYGTTERLYTDRLKRGVEMGSSSRREFDYVKGRGVPLGRGVGKDVGG